VRIILIALLVVLRTFVSAQTLPEQSLRKIAFDQKLGNSLSLDLPFRDEYGKSVKLRDYFGQRPVILVMGYYGCPMLCSFVLNGLTGGLQDVRLQMGKDYEVVYVGIDPTEKPPLALAKKQTYLKRFGQPGAANGWHFLTGDKPAIHQLAKQVGFNYEYDASSHQYAHPSGVVVLSPSGKISHYLSGVVFSGADLSAALVDAAAAKVGSPIEQIFLLCFHYSPTSGKYSDLILTVVRGLGLSVLIGLIAFITMALRRPSTPLKEN
jgi:protein SCO1